MQVKPVSGFRSYAIDIFRAFTMLLMIFVNDLWTLREIPEWLGHVPAKVDGMGLADVVFPAFLFIVGLSIPFALQNRWKRGEANQGIVLHILSRSFAKAFSSWDVVALGAIFTFILPPRALIASSITPIAFSRV